MKILMRPVDMISCTSIKGGAPQPVRFRAKGEGGKDIVVSINRVISVELEKFAGNPMYRYICSGSVAGKERQFEIKFELNTCKWYLFRI